MQKKIFVGVLVLFAAVLLGILAAFLSGQYIREQEDLLRAEIMAEYEPTPVLVPARDLEAGETLETRNMMVREVPTRFMPANPITPGNFRDFEGGVTRVPVSRGTPMVTSFVGEGGSRTGTSFSRIIPEDMRAVTVPVSGPSAVAGLLVPGDRIDLLVQTRGQSGSVLLPLFGNVEIIATGSAANARAADGRYRDVTLKVDPDEARRITEAQELGRLVVNLRNPGDREPMSMEATTAEDVFNGRYSDILNPQEPERDEPARVEIIQGASGAGSAQNDPIREAIQQMQQQSQSMGMGQ